MSLFTSKSLREMLKIFTLLHLYKYINKFIHNIVVPTIINQLAYQMII